MSISHLPEDALATVSEQGWDEDSVIIHLLGFIESKGLTDEIAGYFEEVADEEGADTDPLDGSEKEQS